jgi:iron complex transport system permease protein
MSVRAATTTPLVVAPSRARRHPNRLPLGWLFAAIGATTVIATIAVALGAVPIPVGKVAVELFDQLPFLDLDSGLSATQAAIVTELRLPRVVLALLVGALLSAAGTAYQGVFRNPLADPYLLGVAAGAGLGVTVAIVAADTSLLSPASVVPIAGFVGALLAVGAAYVLGVNGDRARTNTSLILAGVAVAALFTALQTFMLQRDDQAIREVYAWLLGRFNVAGWETVGVLAPYAAVCIGVLLVVAPKLDVMSVGDTEAESLGVHPGRVRLAVVLVATLGTAAAVAASGLIGFVGVIVPHAVRLVVGPSYRRILPLAVVLGGAFMCLADLVARTVLSPAEIPIGVVTAIVGAPFFLLILRSGRGVTT